MSKHRAFLVWAALLLGSGLVELVFGPVEQFFARLSPISIWQLPLKAWQAIAATLIASVVAWLAAILVGGALGLFTAAGELARREDGHLWPAWSAFAAAVRRAFSWLYVVPLVLTLSVIATVLLKLQLDRTLPDQAVGTLLIVASGIALSGQRIFVAIDDAVTGASSDDVMLASSLFLGEGTGSEALGARARRLWQEARFLVACRISLLAQALEQAFHLAVVGVVIVETVSGLRVYEMVFPQEAGVLPWGGGIGRVIIDGQNATNPSLVAGAVWLILMMDSLIGWGVRAAVFRYWVEPYRSRR